MIILPRQARVQTQEKLRDRSLSRSALPQWLEGPVRLDGITVADNIFVSRNGPDTASALRLPFHCGPLCEATCTRGGAHQQCMAVSDSAPCPGCPNCSHTTPWAGVISRNNSVVVISGPLPPPPPPPSPPAGDPAAVQVALCNRSDVRQHWSFDETHGGQIKSIHGADSPLCLLTSGAETPFWSHFYM